MSAEIGFNEAEDSEGLSFYHTDRGALTRPSCAKPILMSAVQCQSAASLQAMYKSYGTCRELMELRNLTSVGELILMSALQRRASVGGHFCLDDPPHVSSLTSSSDVSCILKLDRWRGPSPRSAEDDHQCLTACVPAVLHGCGMRHHLPDLLGHASFVCFAVLEGSPWTAEARTMSSSLPRV